MILLIPFWMVILSYAKNYILKLEQNLVDQSALVVGK